MKTFDLHFTLEQFNSLAQYASPQNELSPFTGFAQGSIRGRLTNPDIVNPDGTPNQEFKEVIDVLAAPGRVGSYSLVTGTEVMDVAWYYPLNVASIPFVSIANDGEELRVQAPSPLDEYLVVARSLLGASPAEFTEMSGSLEITEALVLWGLMDELQNGKPAVKLEELQQAIKAPFSGLDSLAGYFRETLELIAPSKSEIEKAVFRLVQKELLIPSNAGFTPNADLAAVTSDLSVIKTHLHFKSNAFDGDKTLNTTRYWALQGKSGAILLWFEVEGMVTYRMVTPAVLISLLDTFLAPDSTSPPVPDEQANAATIPPPVTPQPAEVVRYQLPVKKGKTGKVLLSLLLGVTVLLVSLFAAGFLIFSPGKGVAFNPSGGQPVTPMETPDQQANEVITTEPEMAVTPTVNDLQIDMVNAVMVSAEQGMVFGRVRNVGTVPVYGALIDLDLKDQAGTILESGSTYPFSEEIAPGEESYFNFYHNLTTPIAFVTTTVSSVSPAELNSTNTALALEKMKVHGAPDVIEIIGEFVNRTDRPYRIQSVFGVAVDANTQIIGAEKAYDYTISLRPGENMPVKVSIPMTVEVAATMDAIQLFAEAYPVDEVVDSPISVSREQNLFRTVDGVVMAGEAMNTSDQPVHFTGLVTALYDTNGDLMDVTWTSVEVGLPSGSVTPYLLYGWNYFKQEPNKEILPASYLILATDSSAYPLEKPLQQLEMTVISKEKSGNWYAVNGMITNINDKATEYGTCVISLRDPQSNKVITAELTWFDQLNPGESAEFTVFMVYPEGIDPDTLDLKYYAAAPFK